MRGQKQVESAISEVKRKISEVQKLQTISTFSGSEQLLSLFQEIHNFYDNAIHTLDPGNPAMNINYATSKACLNLVDSLIAGMTGAEAALEKLKKEFLALNEELGIVMDKKAEHEKNRM